MKGQTMQLSAWEIPCQDKGKEPNMGEWLVSSRRIQKISTTGAEEGRGGGQKLGQCP